ncbi:MAG: hypothetical protein IKR49_04780, partial [Clostridia bacterium]|nr:hypothetical protein [Clostridia bacterium]
MFYKKITFFQKKECTKARFYAIILRENLFSRKYERSLIMGLIKAAIGAAGGMLADQWKEFFYCDA